MNDNPSIIGYFDGACEPNPGGIASYGATVYKDGVLIWLSSEIIFVKDVSAASNNVAEYAGAIRLFEFLVDNELSEMPIEIRGDSQLVINQLFGTWGINSGRYTRLALKAKEILKKFPNIRGRWIPRQQNTFTDNLSLSAINFFYMSLK